MSVYRATAILIVIFWLTMTALLLRNEVKPADSALREVPAGHVVKLLLHHSNFSDLNIVSNKMRLGHLRIMPQPRTGSGMRTIDFKGNLLFLIPGVDRQRVGWSGEVDMDKDLAIRRFRLTITMHEPEKVTSEIVILPAEKVAHYELSTASGVLERQDYTLDENGAREVMHQVGIDPALLPLKSAAGGPPPVIKAQQSFIEVHGERMDTYLVTVEMNGQTWIECHVDQLGHVVRATTLLGYSLIADDIAP
jgi:hypothetical protein